VSLTIDASAAVALHFADERGPFEAMEERFSLFSKDSVIVTRAPRVGVTVKP